MAAAPGGVEPEAQAPEPATSRVTIIDRKALGARLDAIAFGAFDGPLGPALANHGGARFHLAGRIEVSHWGGRQKVELRLEDAAPATT